MSDAGGEIIDIPSLYNEDAGGTIIHKSLNNEWCWQ